MAVVSDKGVVGKDGISESWGDIFTRGRKGGGSLKGKHMGISTGRRSCSRWLPHIALMGKKSATAVCNLE